MRLTILLIFSQIFTLLSATAMFMVLISGEVKKPDKKGLLMSLAGAIIYMLTPYHVYIVTAEVDKADIIVWAVFPILVAAGKCVKAEKLAIKIASGLVLGVCLGIIGREDGFLCVLMAFLLIVLSIIEKNIYYVFSSMLGLIFACKTFLTWKHWIFDASFAESGLEPGSIMSKGLSIGGLFSTYFYRNYRPGMGILIFLMILFTIYLAFVKREQVFAKKDRLWIHVSVLLVLCSLKYFPWDYVERLGTPFLYLVSLIDSPARFLNYACLIMCPLLVVRLSHHLCKDYENDK
jgi:hypothetical protein